MTTRSRLPRGAYRVSSVPEGIHDIAKTPEVIAGTRPGVPAIRTLPLRMRLVVVLVLAALLPLAATTIGGIVIARKSLLSQGQQVLQHRAIASAAAIDNYLAGLQSSLESSSLEVGKLYAADPSLSSSTAAAILHVLHTDSVANDFSASDASDLVGANAVVLVSDQSGEVGEDLRGSASVRAALTGAGYTLAPVTFDPDGSSDLLETIEATVPVLSVSGGHIIGVLRAHFSMGRFVALVQGDATAIGGGLLIERATGLIVAQSLQPSARYIFASVLPSTAQNNSVRSRLADPIDNPTLAIHQIPGLGREQVVADKVTSFAAGTLDGQDASAMSYVAVPIANSPAAAQWVYLLGTSRSALTGPADQLLSVEGADTISLAQLAVVLGAVALLSAAVTGLWMARWTARWLATSVHGLGETARAFLALSRDQRQTAEEQRQRLTTARGGLHGLHQTASELAELVERGISAADYSRQARTQWEGQEHGWTSAGPVPGVGHWSQWALATRERLSRQHQICTSLAHDARSTGEAAARMRERGLTINTQAMALEDSLRSTGSVAVRTSALPLAPDRATGFSARTVRLGLGGILLALGTVPSLLLATSTTTLLRANLAQQSTSALMAQAASSQRAVNQLLAQQTQEVAGLETLYRTLNDPTAGTTPDLASEGLAGSVATAKQPLGTSLLEMAEVASGTVVASSSTNVLNSSVAELPIYREAATGRVQSVTSMVYSVPGRQSWYYIAAPLRSADLTHVIGVAVGQFSVQPLQDILTASHTTQDSSSTYGMVVERPDGIVVADSRATVAAFTAVGPLGQSQLQQLWSTGRYPNGVTPTQTPLPELLAQTRASGDGTPAQGVGFSGASGDRSSRVSYWLVPLSNAPFVLIEAQPVAAANFIADRLTGYDLLLASIVTILAIMLAVILGQSIIVPVQELRRRYREAARRLVAATRRQEDAAHRQEAVLPPIEATAQLLALETEEVDSLLFSQPPPGVPWSPMEHEPPLDRLRRARVLANDWGLRQQRVLADLATALNSTDQLSHASVEGEQEAAALARLADDLLKTAR